MSTLDNGAETQIGAIDPTTGADAAVASPDGPGSVINPFLKNVDPADRPVLEKYLKEWDANVTKRFQGIHEQYRPYKSLGDVDTLRSAMAIYQQLDTDPMQIYRLLEENLADQIAAQRGPSSTPQVPQQQAQEESIWGALPEPAVAKLGQMEQLLTVIAQRLIESDQQKKQADSDQQLETTLEQLRKQHGEFDEEYVLSKMFRGAKPEEAVKAYKDFVQATVAQATRRPVPQVLSGQGGTIPTSQPPKDSAERKAMFADMLANVDRG